MMRYKTESQRANNDNKPPMNRLANHPKADLYKTLGSTFVLVAGFTYLGWMCMDAAEDLHELNRRMMQMQIEWDHLPRDLRKQVDPQKQVCFHKGAAAQGDKM